MTRTLVDIPDDLLEEARQLVGPGTSKAETVRIALAEMVRRRKLAAMMNRLDDGALADLDDDSVVRSAQR